MTRKKLSACRSGSITVEASLMIPFILLAVVFIYYAASILYQQALLKAVADEIADRAPRLWRNPPGDMTTGRIIRTESENCGLYWRLSELNDSGRAEKLRGYGLQAAGKKDMLPGSGKKVRVEIRNYLVYKVLEVSVEEAYRNPAGSILGIFGLPESYSLHANAGTILGDTPELIRNTDFLMDMETELEQKYPGVRKFGEKTRSILETIRNRISKLFM